MKTLLLAAVLAATAAIPASQAVTIDAQVGGGALEGTGIRYLNFNNGAVGDDGVDVTLGGGASAVTWFGNYYAPGFISGDNHKNFNTPFKQGWNESGFLQTGHANEPAGSRITFDFDDAQTYFGLLWGSIDPFNNIAFYLAGQEVLLRNGSQVVWDANGSQLINGTYYVNFTDLVFDQVVLWSDNYSFEVDNVAYGRTTSINPNTPTSVPDGGVTVALLGLSMTGMALIRRKFQS